MSKTILTKKKHSLNLSNATIMASLWIIDEATIRKHKKHNKKTQKA